MIVLLGLMLAKERQYPTDLTDFQEKNIRKTPLVCPNARPALKPAINTNGMSALHRLPLFPACVRNFCQLRPIEKMGGA
jgi:hypothetical protein